MKPHWTNWLVALLGLLAYSSNALRIRDRSAEVSPAGDPLNGQFLRQKVTPVSTTPNPTNQLLNYYAQSQFNSDPKTVHVVSSTAEPVYTSLVEEPVEEENEDYSGSLEISSETTTYRVPPRIPASLRRNHGRGPMPTEEPITELPSTEKPLRKKKKNGTRRRKVKRPIAQRLKQPVPEEPPTREEAVTEAENPMKDGDKNLALEINSDDGKYALIDNFFNQTAVRRPGVVSYKQSDDFPRDNQQTLGNLQENEIWLSDGHLLVLKGGDFDSTNKQTWPPIDNYQRDRKKPPLRIPLDTNNPPPFPVFVNKTGPPVFLVDPPPFLPYPPPGFFGNDSNFDPSLFPPPGMIPFHPNGTLPNLPFPPPNGPQGPFGPPGGGGLYGNGPPGGNYGGVRPGDKGRPGPFPGGPFGPPPGGLYGNIGNNSLPPYPFLPPPGNESFPPPYPFPPPNFNGSFPPNFGPPPPGFNPQNFNGSGPPPFPILPPLVLNPADNETDDPSVFLPPPYDFDYYEDNSTLVPPGPFAPGLVVPPPKDFYTTYNRTRRPPSRQPTPRPSPYFPTPPPETVPALGYPPKKQRPNGKKPKFPMTNPPDDSLEEQYPQTTSIPDPIYTTTKKRKQRPKKPFFPLEGPGDYQNQGKSIESQEEVVPPVKRPPTLIFPEKVPITSPRPNFIQQSVYTTDIVPTYKTPSFKTTFRQPKTTTTTTTSTTTPKAVNNFVYIRGQLKTVDEIAAEEDDQEELDPNRPTTPRPPFDSRGYPTRVVDEEPVVLEYEKGPALKVNRKPTQPPLKAYYPGTPKYEPTYVPYPDNGRVKNANGQYLPSPTPAVIQKRPSQSPPSSRPTILYQSQAPTYIPPKTRGRNHNNQNSQQVYVPQTDYYGNVNLQPQVGPTYSTAGHGLQQPPTSQLTFVPQQPNNYRTVQNPRPTYSPVGPTYAPVGPTYAPVGPTYAPAGPTYDPGPTYAPNGQAYAPNGFRPAFPPPQNPRHTKSRSRLLFPGQGQQQHHQQQQQQQQYTPDGQISYYNNGQQNPPQQKTPKLTNFAPNGYYSPISNFYQGAGPSPTPAVNYQQQFIPTSYPSSAPQSIQGNYNYNPAPISISNYASDPTVPSYNYQGAVSPLQIYQGQRFQQQPQNQQQQFAQYQPQRQQQYHQQDYNPGHPAFNSQLKQFVQPLYDDIAVNYRDPQLQYNTESESVTTRSVVRAGPQKTHELSSTSAPGTFYSFQRGGPGGFSYKIQL